MLRGMSILRQAITTRSFQEHSCPSEAGPRAFGHTGLGEPTKVQELMDSVVPPATANCLLNKRDLSEKDLSEKDLS